MSALPVPSRLAECEDVIERGLHTFVEVGEALLDEGWTPPAAVDNRKAA